MNGTPVSTPTVAIVGAGPAGLTAAAGLAPHVDGKILVLDREKQAGGIPRHSDHTGYGLRDLHRIMTGPAYAARLRSKAQAAGVHIQTESMVTELARDRTLTVTTPAGIEHIQPRALILATGARERPRPARMIAGDRPAGVYTTGHLQNLVHLHHRPAGSRAVVVGGELVSWSAVMTLREAGCRTVLMTTVHERSESYAAFRAFGQVALRVPVAPHSKVVAIEGKHRVEAVQVQDLRSGITRRVECDTVVLTGDWIPDNELVRSAGLDLADGTRGPAVDMGLRTSGPGIFAIGNLVHPVDTADIAALDGTHVVDSVRHWLNSGDHAQDGVRLTVEAPLRWIAPSRLYPDDPEPARGRLLTWSETSVLSPRIEVRQGSRLLTRQRVPWPANPGRAFRIPARVLSRVDRHGDDVTIRLL